MSIYRKGQCKGDIYTADTQAIWSYTVSKAESKFWFWASWWLKRKSNTILTWFKLLSRRESISNVRQADSVVASVIPVSWYSWLCVTFSLWEWSGSMTSNRVWQRWQHMNGYVWAITLHRIILPTLLERTILALAGFEEGRCHMVSCHMKKANEKGKVSSNKQLECCWQSHEQVTSQSSLR